MGWNTCSSRVFPTLASFQPKLPEVSWARSQSFCSLLSSDSAAVRQCLHTYDGKPSPSVIATNSSWLRHPGRSSLNTVVLNNAGECLGATSDKQIRHLLRLPTMLAHMDIARQWSLGMWPHWTVATRPFFSSHAISTKGLGVRLLIDLSLSWVLAVSYSCVLCAC